MCSGCGRVPKAFHPAVPNRAPSRAERAAREAARKACPRCHMAMKVQQDGSLQCTTCGITRS